MQRRPFRIEALLRDSRPPVADEIGPLLHDGEGRTLPRGAADLAAAMQAMEEACHAVLGSAERIDQDARALAGAAVNEEMRALAEDIRAQMVRVYEICNFHDVAGQRIGKVIALLTGLDERLSGFAAPPELAPATPSLINGPRLDGASGHISQDEVDDLLR